MLQRTPLYEAHVAAGARMVPFAGWEMPVQYSGVIDEVRAVRGQGAARCGLFDVSHMGEAIVSGPAALAWLNSLSTNDVSRLTPGRAHYSLLLTSDGGIIDDILVYQTDDDRYLLVLNASNTEKDLAWLRGHPAPGVELRDVSATTGLIALQGPGALDLLAPMTDVDLTPLRRFGCAFGSVASVPALISRTGYTGEDGFELFVGGISDRPGADASQLPLLWCALIDAGAKPCGLGARDVLRIEAGNVLYGHEIDEETNPLEARLEWVVKREKGAFLGSDAILALQGEDGSPARQLVGLEAESRAIPRQGYTIARQGDTLGVVTSGTFSPTLERPIAMGYVPPDAAREGDAVEIIIRDRPEPARIVPLPFYRNRR
jgi:glycine cleavage system T protein (aminomethyltransferase)